ncbi:unnamed protein product [Camellia sinensis]|uniref:DUF3511 domain-containing protein n=1 Tax=Camellia sinensis TaxID=4442 RepID=A0A7J7GL16_CAMSI|nr:hypothetical protein HYC85_019151 [Camellia sinensis]
MEDNRPPYWSYAANQRFESVEPTKTCNPNLVHRVSNQPHSIRPITTSASSSSYALSSHTNDREVKRKKRVATYKAYAMEGKIKASLRNSFRWVKNKYSAIVHGC